MKLKRNCPNFHEGYWQRTCGADPKLSKVSGCMEQEIKVEQGSGALIVFLVVAFVVVTGCIWVFFYSKSSTEETMDYTKFMEDQYRPPELVLSHGDNDDEMQL